MIINRLDEIKKNRESVFGSFTLAADIEWLIEQAEENARLREALKDVHKYHPNCFQGEIARKALEETK